MSTLIRFYPSDRGLEFLLIVTLAVALASSAAWLLSLRLTGKAALRHLVLFSALIGCVATPPLAWFCAATDMTLVSFSVIRGESSTMVPGVTMMTTDPARLPPQPSIDHSPVTMGPPLPITNTTLNPDALVPHTSRETVAALTPSASGAQSTLGPGLTFREITAGAMLVWAAGALVMLARLAWNLGRVMRLRLSSHPLQDDARRFLLQEVAVKMRARHIPLLLVSSRAIAPLAVGFMRPAIILPERLLGAVSDRELRDVLVHELSHIQRGDQRIVLLQELAGALYWPIVSVHALNRELRRAREELCDNAVLAGRDAISYGETLLHVAELLVKPRPTGAAVGILGGRGELERRIVGLIDPRRNTRATAGRKTAWVVMLLFVAWAAIASATRFGARVPSVIAARAFPTQKPVSVEDAEDPKFAGHFSGRVSGPDGKPLSGARVFIIPVHGASNEAGPVRALTDDNGRFAFDAPDMTYTELDGLPARREGLLIVTKPGYGPDWFRAWGHRSGLGFRTHWDPVKGAAVNLQLATDDVPIRGRFLDADGRPLAGARVRLARLMIPRERNLDAHLDREKKRDSIFTLTDYERDGTASRIPGLATETRTDADGRFRFNGLGRDRLAVVSVSAPAVADTDLIVMTRDAPDVGARPNGNGKSTQVIHGAGFTLQLKRGLTIKGLVRDRDTKTPIPGMWVTKYWNPLTDPAYSAYAAVTDEKGRFTITGLDPELLNWEKQHREVTAIPRPGGQHLMAKGFIERDADVLVDCLRGIPFRLRLVDEQGKLAEGTVEYSPVNPNPQIEELIRPLQGSNWPIMNRAARRADGTYEGFVLPGPGAVLVKTPGRNYRPAHVDPKGFFEPGRANWTAQERISTYGTHNTLAIGAGWDDQHAYAAIVLVNPAANSPPLDLSAAVANDKPRKVSLIDPDGHPVVGVKSDGITFHPWDAEPVLRAASFPLDQLHPDRGRRITFIKEDRRLIGFLMARGDGETPYTVRMQPWGTVTGRLLDENGNPLSAKSVSLYLGGFGLETNRDAEAGEHASVTIDDAGRFKLDKMVPGQHYTAEIYRGTGMFAGLAFEKLVLRPGEVRDLGDVRIKPPVKAEVGTNPVKDK